jgi:tRNA (cytidine/uridine-2'-O-)-methyltransferase
MPFNIVLLYPQIPNNTGNIGRLCVATNSNLHLIKPLGFELTEKRLRRAGLDYWQYLKYICYENLDDFFQKNSKGNFLFFSSHSKTVYWDHQYRENDFLVFGREEDGLPEDLLKKQSKNTLSIPMYSKKVRSLNLANSVSIVLYEAIHQIGQP